MATSFIGDVWRAPSGCSQHLRGPLESLVNAFPISWRQIPVTAEVFGSLPEAERRLRAFALLTGFDIVRSGGGNAKVPASLFKCVHHGEKTRNFRGLEDHVAVDKEGEITSRRKRERTTVRQTGCNWRCRVSFKSIDRGGEKGWVLTVLSLEHEGHELTENPLAVYPRFMNDLPDFQEIRAAATSHRIAIIPYSASRRVLESSSEFGLNLRSKQYYNLIRKWKPNQKDPTTIGGLLVALEDEGFVYSTRVEEGLNEKNEVVSRRLVQIWFTHPSLIALARRFVGGFLIVIDGTFNTNSLRLPLLVAVGQLNSRKTFPVAFSWCRSEAKDSY